MPLQRHRGCGFFGVPVGKLPKLRKRSPLGKASQDKLARTNHGFSPYQRLQKNHPKTGGLFWCTRWGSNPNSTASEAVMLSSYTTSTYFFCFHSARKARRIRCARHNEKAFFKLPLYFTIFCFLFASVYGIIIISFFKNFKNFSVSCNILRFLAT